MPRRSRVDSERISKLLAEQNRIVSHAQLRELGMSCALIGERVRTDPHWHRVLPGTYRVSDFPLDYDQKLQAAVVYAGDGAVVTGLAALRVQGLGDLDELPGHDIVDLLIAEERHRKSREFVRVERTSRLPETVAHGGVLVAARARAVADACRHLPRLDDARALIAAVARARFCGLEDVAAEVESGPVRYTAAGRRALREVGLGARSAAEADAVSRLNRSRLPKIQWNAHLYDESGNWLALVDGYVAGVALELQSRRHHFDIDVGKWEAEMSRTRRLERHGVRVAPVSPRQLQRTEAAVISDLADILARVAEGPPPRVRVGPPPPWWGSRMG